MPSANERGIAMSLTLRKYLLFGISLLALAGFTWPLFVPALPSDAQSSAGWVAIALLPVIAIAALLIYQGRIAGPRQIALLGVLASIASATRIATSGVGGFELIFVIVILGAAAVGAEFGFLLGALSIIVSSLFFGGIGPWTAFQVFAVGWVGLGAGLLAKRVKKRLLLSLAIYGFLASYIFGLIMNLWFWPFAVGPATSLSYSPSSNFFENLVSFFGYSLISSTLTWDTVRAVSTAVFVTLLGKPFLATLKRYKF